MTPLAANLSDRYGGAPVHLTRSGSAALVLALTACTPARSGEVVIPAICCPAVLSAVQFAGYTPILSDVDPETLQSGVEDICRVISDRTVAIVAVHLFGVPCDLNGILEMARAKGVRVIEDACLRMGPIVGAASPAATVLSFGYDKPISLDGGGGAVISYDDDMSARLRDSLSRNQFFAEFGACQVVANDHLDRLSEATDERLRNVRRYLSGLMTPLIAFPSNAETHAWWRLSGLVTTDRDVLLLAARSQGIVFSAHYRSLGRSFTHGDLPGAARIDAQIINLFVRPGTAPGEIDRNLDFLNGYP